MAIQRQTFMNELENIIVTAAGAQKLSQLLVQASMLALDMNKEPESDKDYEDLRVKQQAVAEAVAAQLEPITSTMKASADRLHEYIDPIVNSKDPGQMTDLCKTIGVVYRNIGTLNV